MCCEKNYRFNLQQKHSPNHENAVANKKTKKARLQETLERV